MSNPPTPLERARRLGNPGKRKPIPDPGPNALHPAYAEVIPDPLRPLGVNGRHFWDYTLRAGAAWIALTDLELMQQIAEQIDEQQQLRLLVLDDTYRRDKWRDRVALVRLGSQIAGKLSELGLTPTARTRLGLAQVQARAIVAAVDSGEPRTKSYGPEGERSGAAQAMNIDVVAVRLPRKSWRKARIVAWLEINGLEHKKTQTRRELLAIVGVEL
jgi:hypothetical protein